MANEKRLIDAKKLPYSIAVDDNGKQIFYVKAKDIDNAPTVDAVEVIRCKDCKYIEKYEWGRTCRWHKSICDYNEFCSYGERI